MATGPYDWLLAVPGLNGLRVPTPLRHGRVSRPGLSLPPSAPPRCSQRMRPRTRLSGARPGLDHGGRRGAAQRLAWCRFPTPGDARVSALPTTWLRSQPRGPMLELPVGRTREGVRYLTGTLMHGNRIVNGYSGYGWALQDLFARTGQSMSRSRPTNCCAQPGPLGLRYVLVHRPLFRRPGVSGRRLDRAFRGRSRAGRARSWTFGTTSVFVLRPVAFALIQCRSVDPTSAPQSDAASTASDNAGAVGRATDGDVGSRWLTGTAADWETSGSPCAAPSTRVLTERRVAGEPAQLQRLPAAPCHRRLRPTASRSIPLWEGRRGGGARGEPRPQRPPHDDPHCRTARAVPRASACRQTSQTPRHWFWSIDELQLRGR